MTTYALAKAPRLALAAALALFGTAPVLAQDYVSTGTKIDLDVPYVPTPDEVVQKMLDMVQLKEGDTMIDLGSGDGRIAIAGAKRGARAYGVDIDPERVKEANANAKEAGVSDKATFEVRNLFNTNFTQFDVITMYLLPSVNRDLRSRILDLKPGTRIVSHAFDMGEWKADEHVNYLGRDVYFWKVPAKVDSRWTLEADGKTYELGLTQTYQRLRGTATEGTNKIPVEGDIDADIVEIRIGEGDAQRKYVGRVTEAGLEPVQAEGAVAKWSAKRG